MIHTISAPTYLLEVTSIFCCHDLVAVKHEPELSTLQALPNVDDMEGLDIIESQDLNHGYDEDDDDGGHDHDDHDDDIDDPDYNAEAFDSLTEGEPHLPPSTKERLANGKPK